MPAVPLREQLAAALALNEQLRAEVQALLAETESLRDQVAHLEAELGRNSQNSSKPPSSDPMEPRQSRAQRRAAARGSRRRQGKQPGAPGANLARRDPDVVVRHRPLVCRCCHGDLAEAEVVGEVRRQVIDLPPIRPMVSDHVAERRRCRCGAETLAELPPEARAAVCWGPEVRAFALYLMDRQHLPLERCAELLRDVLGAPVSTGWLCGVRLEAAGRLPVFLDTLRDRLAASPVVHADETGTRVRTTRHWVHTVTTGALTLIAVDPRRGADALEAIGVLPAYRGTIVHDGWAPYELMEAATHAQCGAHLLRHVAAVGEFGRFEIWHEQMTRILLDAKAASEAAAEAGRARVAPKKAAAIRGRYHATLDVAFALLPEGPPPPRRHRGGWTSGQRKAWNLATRMRRDADQVLRLLDDTRVPFDNNPAERALRMVKLHDKISGCFHSFHAAQAFAAVRSYVQTAAGHGENLLGVLRQLFTIGPWLPPQPAGGT